MLNQEIILVAVHTGYGTNWTAKDYDLIKKYKDMADI